jgi:hypothetical protein
MTGRAASGDDPMAEGSSPADTAHAMKTASRYDLQEVRARGRFGRDVRTAAAHDDVPMADARKTMHTDRGEERLETAGYHVDPDAVASAIVHRLLAGRTLPPARDDERG